MCAGMCRRRSRFSEAGTEDQENRHRLPRLATDGAFAYRRHGYPALLYAVAGGPEAHATKASVRCNLAWNSP
jgi:hypothetical protein